MTVDRRHHAQPQGLPDEPLNDVFARLWQHTVLLSQLQGPNDEQGQYAGTATLVHADRPCLLTAAHVWEKLSLGGLDPIEIGLLSRNDHQGHPVLVGRSAAKHSAFQLPWSEWGPDLALIPIGDKAAADLIDRDKSFYLLDKARPAADPLDMWTLIGAPGEEIHLGPSYQEARTHLYRALSEEVRHHDRDGFHYVDVPARQGLNDRPQSYKGLSGSGLWRFNWARDQDGQLIRKFGGDAVLEGVVFYELPTSPGRPEGAVRAHTLQDVASLRAS